MSIRSREINLIETCKIADQKGVYTPIVQLNNIALQDGGKFVLARDRSRSATACGSVSSSARRSASLSKRAKSRSSARRTFARRELHETNAGFPASYRLVGELCSSSRTNGFGGNDPVANFGGTIAGLFNNPVGIKCYEARYVADDEPIEKILIEALVDVARARHANPMTEPAGTKNGDAISGILRAQHATKRLTEGAAPSVARQRRCCAVHVDGNHRQVSGPQNKSQWGRKGVIDPHFVNSQHVEIRHNQAFHEFDAERIVPAKTADPASSLRPSSGMNPQFRSRRSAPHRS